MSRETIESLLVRSQPDGSGIWGRWNANGPGTARLFHELGLGPNFTNLERARAGDFLKLWWNTEIGAREKGHSVIYIGRNDRNMEESITFWSANMPGGYGYKTVPFSRVKRALFSRLERPAAINGVTELPRIDQYLVEMGKRAGSEEEMLEKTGAEGTHGTSIIPGPDPSAAVKAIFNDRP